MSEHGAIPPSTLSTYRKTCKEQNAKARKKALIKAYSAAAAIGDGRSVFLAAKSAYLFSLQQLVRRYAVPGGGQRAGDLYQAYLALEAGYFMWLAAKFASVGAKDLSAPCAALMMEILDRMGPTAFPEAARWLADLRRNLALPALWPEPAGLPPDDAGASDARLGPLPLETSLAVRNVLGD